MDGNTSAPAKSRKFGLTASELKYIAILAMLIDHIAHLYIDPENHLLYGGMRFIGRMTAPIMCFFLTEGFHHTRSLKKYFVRMGVFAVISHFAFTLCFHDSLFSLAESSVITTLLLALFTVYVWNSGKIDLAFKLPLIVAAGFLAEYCDWGMDAILFTLAFELARGNRTKQVAAYSIVAFVRRILPALIFIIRGAYSATTRWHLLGLFLPALLLMLYNGEKGGGKYTKWVFYIFYPAHLLLLAYINYRIS